MNLEKLLFFTNHQKILRFFLDNPEEKYYDRQVSLLTKVSRAGTNFALRDLSKVGILKKETKGKLNFYYILVSDPIIKELKVLLNVLLIAPLIEKTKEYCSKIVLFGSTAKGVNTKESDIDILFVTPNKEKINTIIMKDNIREKLQPVILTQNDFVGLQTENPIFYEKIIEGKILWIKG